NFCQLMPILAYIGTHGCDVFDRNEKVQKTPKHDFWTYWSVLGAFVAKTPFVIRAANFCQLMPILAYIGPHGCDVFDRNEKVQKAPKHDFWTYWSVLGAFVAKTYFLIRAANFCQLMPILAHTGAMFLTGMKKFKKHQNMIFGHIGVYWVRSWQKHTS
ncbi:hypothetical protein SL994_23460, partial [Escherichia coli]|uniref:hypothetical protein n=1 Tax=Escherichia coli TaxID=562 RepID=UPI00307AEA76